MINPMERHYLAGPMSGIPQFNFPAFKAAAEELRLTGIRVESPHELDDPATAAAAWASIDGSPGSGAPAGQTWGDFLARDVKTVADKCDGLILLPGWSRSRGARLEAFVGVLTGKKFYTYPDLTPRDPRAILEIVTTHTRESLA